jgi:hypothetical protein
MITVTRTQIFPALATSFNTGTFTMMAVDQLAKGHFGMASLDLAVVAVNAAAAVIIATKIFRALPASGPTAASS